MTSPGSSPAANTGPAADAGKKVLRFGDGSSKLSDPDLYLPKGLGARLTQDSPLRNAIIQAFVVSVATAVTVAATKSAASTRA